MKGARSGAFTLAALLGFGAGWALAQRYLHRHQTALFSPHRRRRHAALGYLAGRPTPENVRLLKDYLAWESHPILKRRASRVVRELTRTLG
ncbi:MAG: hypothetical protein ACT4PM_09555 [Gemmatimonadales bacterium]